MDISNICVIGDDKRMDYTAEALYSLGFDVYRNKKYINNKSMIVLAPPANEKMTRLIIPYLEYGQFLYAGSMSNRLIHQCELMKIKYVDYLKIEELTKTNAVLTAKGLIKYALSDNVKLNEGKCMIAGYGFCGKAISKVLSDFDKGISIDILVRRKELKPEIENEGYGFIDLNSYSGFDFKKYRYIFNTVPALIFNKDFIDLFSDNVMIFDIASKDGGVDFSYCKEKNIYAKQFPGIPGKIYPVEAGKAIAMAIINDINLR